MTFRWQLLCRQFRDLWNPIKWAWQRAFLGYDDRALWDLHFYLATIAAPILGKMCEKGCGYPASITSKKWEAHLHKMYQAMWLIAEDRSYTENEEQVINEGIKLFGKWYRDLWT